MSAPVFENHPTGTLGAIPMNATDEVFSQAAIVHESRPECELLRVFGEIDLTSADELRNAIDSAAGKAAHVIVDLAPCTYIDSTILSVLIRANESYAGRFQIAIAPTGIVRRVFTITSLMKELPILETTEGPP
jgi:anti-sigma B factor antagonist